MAVIIISNKIVVDEGDAFLKVCGVLIVGLVNDFNSLE